MQSRRGFGVRLSLVVVAASLASTPLSLPARAGERLAFVEIGAGDAPSGGCEARGLGKSPKGRAGCGKRAIAPAPRVERPLFAVVSIADQSVSIYNHDGLVTRSEVSTGMAGHDTPKGIYSIIGRERMHASNIYSGAPMPFMQRLTWSGIAMHLGVVPGHPASHGCVRLPAEFAAKLWGLTRIGERVVIAPHDVTPSFFSHSLLPAPKMQLFADAGAAASAPPSTEGGAATAEPPRLNPHQYAERLKAKAANDRKAALKAEAEAFLAVEAREEDALRLANELGAAESALDAARAKADAAAAAFGSASGIEKDAAAAAKSKAEEERDAAVSKFDGAKKASEANVVETAEAYKRWTSAARVFEEARAAEKDAEIRTAPVSVLISKADKRVYVRQGLAPVFDAPATVRDPKAPLGSHLYIASATDGDGAALKWSVISIAPQIHDERGERRKGKAGDQPEVPSYFSSYSAPSVSPEEALERVELSQEVRDRIAERLWTGASIIISDQPLSGETNNVGTDLVVRLR